MLLPPTLLLPPLLSAADEVCGQLLNINFAQWPGGASRILYTSCNADFLPIAGECEYNCGLRTMAAKKWQNRVELPENSGQKKAMEKREREPFHLWWLGERREDNGVFTFTYKVFPMQRLPRRRRCKVKWSKFLLEERRKEKEG